jgi:hypothetical protein
MARLEKKNDRHHDTKQQAVDENHMIKVGKSNP